MVIREVRTYQRINTRDFFLDSSNGKRHQVPGTMNKKHLTHGTFQNSNQEEKILNVFNNNNKSEIKVILAFSLFPEYFTGVVCYETFFRKCRPFVKTQHLLGQKEGEEQTTP